MHYFSWFKSKHKKIKGFNIFVHYEGEYIGFESNYAKCCYAVSKIHKAAEISFSLLLHCTYGLKNQREYMLVLTGQPCVLLHGFSVSHLLLSGYLSILISHLINEN